MTKWPLRDIAQFTFPRFIRHSRLLAAVTIALALAATQVIAQFGSFSGEFAAFEGELWGVRHELTLADQGDPGGVAYTNGILFVADQANETVVAFDSDGEVVAIHGAEWQGFTPSEILATTVSVDGNDIEALLISDAAAHRVLAFSTGGARLFTLQLERTGFVGAVGAINGLAIGPASRFALTTGAVPALTLQGSFAAGWANQWESEGVVLAYRNQVSLPFNSALGHFEPAPTAILDGTEGAVLAPPGQVSFGVVFDGLGNLYTIDTNTERLNVYDESFGHRFTFGTPAFDGTLEEFEQPYGMAYSPFDGGRLFIGDSDHHRVRIYRPNLANATLDYVSTIDAFGDGLPRSVAIDPLSGELAITDLEYGRVWIMDRPGLAAFNLQVLDAAGDPVDEVCTGDPYQLRFSLTVPAGGAPVASVLPTLSIDGADVTEQPIAASVYSDPMSAGDVMTFTYSLVAPQTVSLDGLAITAGATASTPNVLFRQGTVFAANCVGLAPTITAAPSIPPQVSGWTPVMQGQTLELTLTANDDAGVASIEYVITGQNNRGVAIPPVVNPTPGITQTLVLPLPETGYSTIQYRAHDSDGRKSAWQQLRVRIQSVFPRVSVEGDTVTLAVGLPIGSGYAFTSTGLPRGLTMDAGTGQIGGTLGFDSAGEHTVVVSETLGALTSTVSFVWTVVNANRPPIVEPVTGAVAVEEGASFAIAIEAHDPDGDPSYFTMFGHSVENPLYVLPPTVVIHPVTGVISGYFPSGSQRAYTIFVGLSECAIVALPSPPCPGGITGARLATLMSFTMAVTPANQPPFAFPPASQSNTEGDAIAGLQISASDPDGDALVYRAVNLPPGLTIDASTGVISGVIDYNAVRTPYAVVVEVDDQRTATYAITFLWTVANLNRTPVISAGDRTNQEGDAIVNLSVSVASDPDLEPLTYAATGLPPGLAMNSASGAVSGSLSSTSAGLYRVVVTVSDGSLTASAPFAWTVINVNAPPVVTNPGPLTSAEGTSVSVAIVATDADGEALTYSSTGLPPGLSINSVTGVIAGTLSYSSAGTYTVTVTARDRVLADSETFTWLVKDAISRPPVCSATVSASDLWPPNHKPSYLSLTGITDPDGDAITIRYTGILQDEPVHSVGQGNTPNSDAGIEADGARAWVRSERTGNPAIPGDGRVYLIGYTASDATGASCTGTAQLALPHDQRGTPAVLSPGRWNSLDGQLVFAPPPDAVNVTTAKKGKT